MYESSTYTQSVDFSRVMSWSDIICGGLPSSSFLQPWATVAILSYVVHHHYLFRCIIYRIRSYDTSFGPADIIHQHCSIYAVQYIIRMYHHIQLEVVHIICRSDSEVIIICNNWLCAREVCLPQTSLLPTLMLMAANVSRWPPNSLQNSCRISIQLPHFSSRCGQWLANIKNIITTDSRSQWKWWMI